MKKKLLSVLLAVMMCLALFPAAMAADASFTDVPADAWYYGDVISAVETGLVNGKTDTTYCPNDYLTYAEAVKLAACMHQKYTLGVVSLVKGKPWYSSFVDYAKMNGIISRDYDWTAYVTRAGYMEIFAHALPDSALPAINTVQDGAIPDVSMKHPQAAEIYKLYRAGVVSGSNEMHYCYPDDCIKRSEVAAILTRMMYVGKRVTFSLSASSTAPTAPKGTPEAPKTETLRFTVQPKSAAAKLNQIITYSVSVSGGKKPYSYKWEMRGGFDCRWWDAACFTDSFSIKAKQYLFDGQYQFRCIVTDADGKTITSDAAVLRPMATCPPLKIETQPMSQYLTALGKTLTFTVKACGGAPEYNYLWTVSRDGCSWFNLGVYSKQTFSITFTPELLWSVCFVRCLVTDDNGQCVTSDIASIRWAPCEDLKVVVTSNKTTVDYDGNATLKASVSGGKGPYTYNWAVYNDTRDAWEYPAIGNGESTFYLSNMKSTRRVRCEITDAYGTTVKSNEVKVTVKD